MNKFAFIVYILFFTAIGLHEKWMNKPVDTVRLPSNIAANTNSCHSGMRYLFRKSTRTRQFRQMIMNADISGIKKLFWDSHEKERLNEKIAASGFTRWLRKWNHSTFAPALYQTKNNFVKNIEGGDVDTVSTLWKVADDEVEFSEDEAKAVANVRSWMGYVNGYRNRINAYLENSVEYHRQIDRLKEIKWEPGMEDLDGSGVEIPMIFVKKDDDGNIRVVVEQSRFYPTSQMDIDFKIRNLELETSTIFAGNFRREARRKSKLYEAMLDQALYWRRLELANERFGRIAVDKLSPEQKQLMKDIRTFLAQKENAPRADAMLWVKKKEARVELWQALRLWKSNRVANNMEFEMPKFMLDRAASVSPVALITPLFFIAAGTAKTMISNTFEDNPSYQYYTGLVSDGANNFMFNFLGWSSAAMRACFEAEREWTRNEVAQAQIIKSHLSRWIALDRLEPEANHLQSTEYIRQRNELFAECRERAQEHRSLEYHADGKNAILSAQVSRLMAHKILEEIIIEHHDGGRRLARKIYGFFEAREYHDDTRADELRNEITSQVGQEFFDQLVEYEENLLLIEERLGDASFESSGYFDSVQGYFDYINGFVPEEETQTEENSN